MKAFEEKVILDTMGAETSSFGLKEKNKLKFIKSNCKADGYDRWIKFCDSGNILKAQYLTNHGDKEIEVRVTISTRYINTPPKLKIEFEPGKLIYGNNLNPISHKQYCDAINMVKKYIRDLGIAVDFKDLIFYRCDLAENVSLESIIANYTFLQNYGKYIRNSKYEVYENGNMRKSNNSLMFKIYDKKLQLKEMHNMEIVGFEEKEIMRAEVSMRNKRMVKEIFAKNGLKPQFNCLLNVQNWRKLMGAFRYVLNEYVFFDKNLGNIGYKDWNVLLESLKTKKINNATKMKILVVYMANNEGNLEQLIRQLANGNPEKASRLRRQFKNLIEKYSLYKPACLKRYKEFMSKIFDPNHLSEIILVRDIGEKDEKGKTEFKHFIIHSNGDRRVS